MENKPTCPKCGCYITPDSRFCPTCGSKLGKASRKRKPETDPFGRPSQFQEQAQTRATEPHIYHSGENPYSTSAPTAPMSPTAYNEVPDYTKFATVLTVFNFIFCNPVSLVLAIIALRMSKVARESLAAGQTNDAFSSSKTAKTLCWISLGITIAIYVLAIFLYVFGIIFTLTTYG